MNSYNKKQLFDYSIRKRGTYMSNKTNAVVKTNPRKAVMIGCGFVGSASVFALMQSGLFF